MKGLPAFLSAAVPLSFLLLAAGGCGDDQSGSTQSGRTILLPAGETHEGWYFVAAERVIINGTVNGDAYIAAGQVEVHGTINGDLLVAGGDVEIGGTVTDDVRVAGGNVRMNGAVGKNVSAVGGNIAVSPAASIAGGLLVASGSLIEGGTVLNNLRAAVGQVEVTGSVGKNVDVVGGQLTVARGANVGGDLTAMLSAKDRSEIAEGAVKGAINVKQKEEDPTRVIGIRPKTFWFKVFWVGSLLLTGLVLYLLSRRSFTEYGTIAMTRLGWSLLWGLGLVVVTPIAVILLCATIIGIPLGLTLLALYLFVLYLSQLSIGIAAGVRQVGPNMSSGWILYFAFVVGTIIFQGLSLIPIVGVILEIVVLFVGSGAIAILIKGRLKNAA